MSERTSKLRNLLFKSMKPCTCEDVPHYCDWFSARRQLEMFLADNAGVLLELISSLEGLNYGEDWNNGTHAEIYRPFLKTAIDKWRK